MGNYKEIKLTDREVEVLTDKEVEVLKVLSLLGYEWLARDFDRELYAFVEKPEKGEKTWFNYSQFNSYIDKDLFTFIKWEDKEPTKIDDLLKGMS